ncbi:MAG: hypothetical protein MUC44_05650, partial [Beijerinckiaceae bacterium]|nr:hypothetical protein [Beijerinckiaceae bacterium]
ASEGIGQPEREVAVKGLDRIEDTLEELVDTLEEAQEAQAAAYQARRKPVAGAPAAIPGPVPDKAPAPGPAGKAPVKAQRRPWDCPVAPRRPALRPSPASMPISGRPGLGSTPGRPGR